MGTRSATTKEPRRKAALGHRGKQRRLEERPELLQPPLLLLQRPPYIAETGGGEREEGEGGGRYWKRGTASPTPLFRSPPTSLLVCRGGTLPLPVAPRQTVTTVGQSDLEIRGKRGSGRTTAIGNLVLARLKRTVEEGKSKRPPVSSHHFD